MQHPNIVEFEITGDYALFTDPITRAGGEKCTLQIPTYEALKGALGALQKEKTAVRFFAAENCKKRDMGIKKQGKMLKSSTAKHGLWKIPQV